jgi:hypothetical protein
VCLAGLRRPALIMAAIGLALAVVILLDPEILISEAGGSSPISAWRPGYFFWVSSFAVALVCACLTPASPELAPKPYS